MADTTANDTSQGSQRRPGPPRGPDFLAPFARAWGRISSSLVPVLAVITALIVAVPLLLFTQSDGDINRGLRAAGQAYSGLLEGSLGLSLDARVDTDDVAFALDYIDRENEQRAGADRPPFSFREVNVLAQRAEELVNVGPDNVSFYSEVIDQYYETELLPTNFEFDRLGDLVPTIQQIGPDRLREYGDLIVGMDEADRSEVDRLAADYGSVDAIDDRIREDVESVVPAASEYSDSDLRDALALLQERGIVRLVRAREQLQILDELGLSPFSDEAEAIASIHELTTTRSDPNGVRRVQQIAEAAETFRQAGVENFERLASEMRLIANFYGTEIPDADRNILTNPNVAEGLRNELPEQVDNNLIVHRPNNQVLVIRDTESLGGVINRQRIEVTSTTNEEGETVTSTEELTVADKVYLNLGSQVLLFFPANLEDTLTRSIPFIIAGLGVALGFRSGLFNIGAEGQLYIGATLAAWFGFAGAFDALPSFMHVPLVLIGGLIGGALWGMIPGMLKAYTGAHEVINTIMLNFTAILLTDWLIKSTDPVILRDVNASAPRTPLLDSGSRLVTFDTLTITTFLIAAVVAVLFRIWARRNAIRKDTRQIIQPLLVGVIVFIGGLALNWLTVAGNLHIGLVVAMLTVFFVDWFLNRTTYGFELRTVGANQDAARYAGMNVRRNIVLALTLSGALAGLAGIVQIAGVQYSMEPEFFSGLGFDAIAVALLARNNPRNMIPAGILWGALIAGSGSIQIYGIPVDLVTIIQALIIMFIAADAIIRTLWQVPEASEEEKAATVLSTGWGG